MSQRANSSTTGYYQLLESRTVGVFVASIEGEISQANDVFLDMIGIARNDLPIDVDTMTPPEYWALDEAKRDEVHATGSGMPWEKEYMRADGSRVPVLVGVCLVDYEEGNVVCYAMDLSRAQRTEAGREHAKACSKEAFDEFHLIYFTVDSTGVIYAVNTYGADHLGYLQEEMLGRSLLEFIHPADRDLQQRQLEASFETAENLEHCQIRARCRDGTKMWLKESIRGLEGESGRSLSFIVCEDITEQKLANEKLASYLRKLRKLSAEAALAEERERRRIAIGLHDEVGHRLAIAKLMTGALRGLDQSDESHAMIDEINAQLDGAISATRDLTTDLSSPLLYDLGLAAALQGLGERIGSYAGFRFHLECNDLPNPPREATRVIIYRIARELLFNVFKHAKARNVRVTVKRVDEQLEIAVEDDGVGFACEEGSHQVPDEGFGLFSIHEQIGLFGGHFEIHGAPGRGTRALLIVPLSENSLEPEAAGVAT